jgi:endo-1,3-1,4-beta-glycanase ExoK
MSKNSFALAALLSLFVACGPTGTEVDFQDQDQDQALRRRCGDGVCHKTERCSTCPQDCGVCQPDCIPTTCEAQGKNCGSISDGCGGSLSCGSCASPETCGGGGTANVCGGGNSTPDAGTPSGGGTVGSQFQLIFEDHFNASDLDGTVWTKYGATSDWDGHGGNGLRVGRAISVANGIATITATPAAQTSTGELESGGFTIKDPYRIAYGRYEVRIRVDDDLSRVTSGLALLWNTEESVHPWCQGENDFYETGTSRDDFSTFLHYELGTPNCSDGTTQVYFDHNFDPRVWHVISLEWRPNRYEVFVDGVSDGVTTNPDYIPDWVQRLTFQLDAMNSGVLAAPVRLQIDYVRIYKYVP